MQSIIDTPFHSRVGQRTFAYAVSVLLRFLGQRGSMRTTAANSKRRWDLVICSAFIRIVEPWVARLAHYPLTGERDNVLFYGWKIASLWECTVCTDLCGMFSQGGFSMDPVSDWPNPRHGCVFPICVTCFVATVNLWNPTEVKECLE
ncbi:hypothetical protein CDAR_303741 [Caerostris darwini]|uniref:Uncharacterized protein n=1 Tax=Caerostris darwini TaxID=1538125 RepID=A0AAV4T4Z4_9ARAC|nr:hypothetical protein CDAR_303741 [Caerostris darwini]